jgi:uncharacterized protein YtpQ (UPF0354 family)
MLELQLKEKSVYGNTLVYPNCPKSYIFARLVNKKTFDGLDIHLMGELGYTVKIQKL